MGELTAPEKEVGRLILYQKLGRRNSPPSRYLGATNKYLGGLEFYLAIFYFTGEMEGLMPYLVFFSPRDRLYFHHALWSFIYFTYFPKENDLFLPKKLQPRQYSIMVSPLQLNLPCLPLKGGWVGAKARSATGPVTPAHIGDDVPQLAGASPTPRPHPGGGGGLYIRLIKARGGGVMCSFILNNAFLSHMC